MRVKNHPDWPKAWNCAEGDAPTAAEVSAHGILTGIRLSLDAGIYLQLDYKSKKCDGYFLPKDRVAELRRLRDTLVAYRNTPMSDVESIEL